MIKYTTDTFELNDDDILWEKFMCFMRQIIPWEKEQLSQLSTIQKSPVIAFIYSSEVMGDGHISFGDLYGRYIKNEDVINALKTLSIQNKYINNIERMPSDYPPIDELAENLSYEEFEKEIERIGEIYDEFDNIFYKYGDEHINEKIIEYVRQYHLDFFEYK